MKTLSVNEDQHRMLRDALDQFVQNTEDHLAGEEHPDPKQQKALELAQAMLEDLNLDVIKAAQS